MENYISQLLALAKHAQEAVPDGLNNVTQWMEAAEDLVNACVHGGDLVRELRTILPLGKQGEFLRAVRMIKAASGQYSTGLRPEVDTSLRKIVKALEHERLVEEAPPLNIKKLGGLAVPLTSSQSRLLDYLWTQHLQTGKPAPVRSTQVFIGKSSVEEILKGLSGSVLFETQEGGDRCFQLTQLGAFLTSYGATLHELFLNLLRYVRDRFEAEPLLKSLQKAEIDAAINLLDEQSRALLRVLALGVPRQCGFYLSGWNQDGTNWSVTITDDVIGLYRADDSKRYLDDVLSEQYRVDEPVSLEDRLRREGRSQAPIALAFGVGGNSGEGKPGTKEPPFIHPSRLEELRAIKSPKFDCTRLIRLCDELNHAAEYESAHAVAFLTRAILDHIPPIFNFKNFSEFVAQYPGGSSFKKTMERLEKVSRPLVDRLLHMPIGVKEVTPNMTQVSFKQELDALLGEVCRELK